MTSRYALEKFSSAVHSLCLSQVTLQQRLISVCQTDLGNIVIERDIPTELRTEFQTFLESLKVTTPVADEGLFQATISQMGEMEIHQKVEQILSMHRRIIEHFAMHK